MKSPQKKSQPKIKRSTVTKREQKWGQGAGWLVVKTISSLVLASQYHNATIWKAL